MSYELHVMTADPELAKWYQRLSDLSKAALKRIASDLPLHSVDIVIYRNPDFVIPELGICGYAPTAHLAFVSVDPLNENFEASIEVELPATLAHELHHCLRWSGPGYGKTLREALITEGLAQHYETGFRNAAPPFYSVALDATQLQSIYERAKPELDSAHYNHREWFFGSESRGIPRHAAYSLGFYVVAGHLKRLAKTAAELWNEPASSFEI